jgi:small subunit ribosomal protein S20
MKKKQTREQKRARQAGRRRLRRASIVSLVKTSFKKALGAIKSNQADLAKTISSVVKIIDRASAKGAIHRNQAARKKSRLMFLFNKAASLAKKS